MSQIYITIRYGKVLAWGTKIFPLGGVQGAQDPLLLNLRPPIISETTGAKKFKLKTQLDVVKYSFRVQVFFPLGGVQGVQGPLM